MGKVVRFSPPPGGSSSRDVVPSIAPTYNCTRVSTQIETKPQDGQPFLLGRWLVEPTLNRLTLGTTSVQLEHKAMDVLLCLVEHAGEVVPKNDLLDAVWQTEFVSDNTLQGRIAEIRDAIGDDAQNPSFIETIRKKGYRLICEIGTPDLDDPVQSLPNSPTKSDEDRNPYPGLAAFTEDDADVFFGREMEIATLWRKITSRRLMALIGPSGIGKSSLLRAGVATRAPPGWRVLVFTPGEDPAMSLARALAPDHAGDPSAVSRLVGFNDLDTALAVVSRWRGQFEEVVLVVDQFEELFTLNTPEDQARFIDLLRRLVDAADIHVVLSMRDDYLHQCQRFPEIAPIFDGLTPLGSPGAEALRRAITEPAARRLHRFESERLVDRMIAEVEEQRGALPLLAFAVRQLWERRDRDERLLTEETYDAIGGVAGALARHAEALMGEIGQERLPIVREIFRNLVTADGTRAVHEVDELLSVFNGGGGEGVKPSPTTIQSTPAQQTVGAGFTPAREAATEVLGKLIDARLLTSFETHDDEELSTRRVEIVHESLLAAWPRLVRWQTQDQEGAQLRDELRLAARTWDEHGRHDDRLWTGTAYREFQLWRERYPGGLTEVEEAFAAAMTSFAKRRSRRRRLMVAALIVVLLTGLAVVGTFWRQSKREARRADAANLVSLGQLEIESNPSVTIGHAIASLELADNIGARRLALEALWRGPTALVVNDESSWAAEFTPDGRSLVQGGETTGHIRLIHADGTSELLDHSHEATWIQIRMAFETDVFFSFGLFPERPQQWVVSLWSASERRLLGSSKYEGTVEMVGMEALNQAVDANRRRGVYLVLEGGRISVDAIGFDGEYQRLGTMDFDFQDELGSWAARALLDPRAGEWVGVTQGDEAYVVEIGDREVSPPRLLGRHEGISRIACDPQGRYFATADAGGEIRLWGLSGTPPPTVLQGPPNSIALEFTDDGSFLTSSINVQGDAVHWVWSFEGGSPRLLGQFTYGQWGIGDRVWDTVGRRYARSGPDLKIRLWSMRAPADAEPTFLLRGEVDRLWEMSFHPSGHWLASADRTGVALWPLARSYPIVIRGHEKRVYDVRFDPGGRWLASCSLDDTVRIWPLEGEAPLPGRVLLRDPGKQMFKLAWTPDGEQVLVGTAWSGFRLLPLSGEESQAVPGGVNYIAGTTISPDGQLAAGVVGANSPETRILVWDLSSGEVVTTLRPKGRLAYQLQFTGDGRLLSSSEHGLHSLNIGTGESELLYGGEVNSFSANIDRNRVVLIEGIPREANDPQRAVILDLETGETRILGHHGTNVSTVALGQDGTTVVTADYDGVVRVGTISDDEPHLLLGHEDRVRAVDIDPLGRWIASGSHDATIRLWPMPDLTKPPLHTLPLNELVAKLKTLTNLRVVRDPESSTGWALTHDPFPGWETVPTW